MVNFSIFFYHLTSKIVSNFDHKFFNIIHIKIQKPTIIWKKYLEKLRSFTVAVSQKASRPLLTKSSLKKREILHSVKFSLPIVAEAEE